MDILNTSLATVSCKGKEFLVCPCSSLEPHSLLSSFVLEAELRERWFDVCKGDIVVDVGAGFGSYTLTALTCGAAKVLAWETNRNVFFDLATNLAVNGFLDRCILINALADSSSCVVQNFFPLTCSLVRREGNPERRTSLSVDDSVREYSPNQLDWIKIDVEGHELSVLRGSKESIEKFHPRLLIENHEGFVPGISSQVREFMRPFGYVEERVDGIGINDHWSKWTPK